MSVLERAVADLGDAVQLGDVQVTVRTAARQSVRADGATFVLRDIDQCFYADEDAMSPLWKGQRFPIEQCISGWAILNDEVAIVPDIMQDERIPLDAYLPTFVESVVMVPVGIDKPVAAIGVYWSRPHHATSDELATLRTLAHATAIALDRVGLDGAPVTLHSLATPKTS